MDSRRQSAQETPRVPHDFSGFSLNLPQVSATPRKLPIVSPRISTRACLVSAAIPVHNFGYDNESHDLIVYSGDCIRSPTGIVYTVLETLGQGTFGQVFKCQFKDQQVAIKVAKNLPEITQQAQVEFSMLRRISLACPVVARAYDCFIWRSHVCTVFELLSINLYNLLEANKFRGLSLTLVSLPLPPLCHPLTQGRRECSVRSS